MAKEIKKYLITSLTLGLIAASGALLVAGTYLIANPFIEQNKKNKIISNISAIYKNDTYQKVDFLKPEKETDDDIKIDKNNKYVNHVYYIYDRTNKEDNADYNISDFIGVAFRTEGSNSYGKISLIIGFNLEGARLGLKEVINEQSFASTLKKKYIIPLNSNERDLTDIHCGATYGATTVRDMILNAKDLAPTYIEQHQKKGANNG